MLYLKGSAKINYETRRKTSGRPSNCMLSQQVWDSSTNSQKHLVVIDYYSPRNKKFRAGWYVALRKPGYVPRSKPMLVLFIKSGYEPPTLEKALTLLETIFN